MRRLQRTNRTLLLVCEGYGERELVRVMRDCYLPRDCGTALTSENARGFGGTRSLEIALQRQRESEYDAYGVLVDTDRGWSNADRQRAQAAGIVCIENEPCLEATLLAVAGARVRASTRENKDEFLAVFGSPAHRPYVIARRFDAASFDAARGRVAAIDTFLRFLGR
jgi:hypothetical protein